MMIFYSLIFQLLLTEFFSEISEIFKRNLQKFWNFLLKYFMMTISLLSIISYFTIKENCKKNKYCEKE